MIRFFVMAGLVPAMTSFVEISDSFVCILSMFPIKKRRHEASVSRSAINSILPQPSRRMREQGIDHPGLRGEVAAQYRRPPLVARDLVEQALELGDVAVDRLLEVAVGAIFAGDLIERLLAGRGVEPL